MRLKIAAKIGLGFGIMIIAVIINAFVTSNTLEKSRRINNEISNIYSPSKIFINDLYSKINDSRMLIKSWVFIDKISNTPDKNKLESLHQTDYKLVIDTLKHFAESWAVEYPERKALLYKIDSAITNSLFPKHQYVMGMLSSFESYDDPFVVFEVTPMTEEGGEVMLLTQEILKDISVLKDALEKHENEGRLEMENTFTKFKKSIFIMLFILVITALAVGIFTINSLVRPINHTKNILLAMSKGVLPKDKLAEGNDELGQMDKALNLLVQSLKDIFNFSLEIGKGNFDTDFKPLSNDDVLGHSLVEMRNELKKAEEEEKKRKIEDDQRNWAAQGVAMFSDILRKNNDDLEELSYDVISNMVKYTNSNQGGIFILNDNDRNNIVLEMTGCYAYDRKKFLKRTVEVGEGLVGRCYLEKEKIFLTEIPDDYIKITSGLGDDNPRCILLIPLIYNDIVYGIMEIASFTIFQEYEIQFIERISESIAASISTVKANIQTTQLLEQSQQQAEEMSSQEEEMRQNMEELRATQEQSARREEELRHEVEELKKRLQELQ